MNRRKFLIGGATAAGALIVGYAVWPDHRLEHIDEMAAGPDERFLATWIKLANDGTITVVIPHCDMGSGTYTPLAQMAADELDADWTKIRTITAPSDPLFANGALAEGFGLASHISWESIPSFLRGPAAGSMRLIAEHMDLQTTGGSSAVRFTGFYGMRIAGAAVREMLVQAAADRLHAAVDALRTEKSRVIHTSSGQSLSYGELAAEAARLSPPSNPKLKGKSAFQLIGKPVQRLDIPAKVNGAAKYGIDTQVPGMVYGAIHISPVFGGKLVSVDEASATRQPGVKKVVKLDDAVVVIADRFWRAHNAVDALHPVFSNSSNGDVSSQRIRDAHLVALNSAKVNKDLSIGKGADALQNASVFERTYNVPYLAHAPMEPANATVLYKDGTLEVWSGTQDGLGSRAFCAKAAGLPLEKVTFHLTPSGGAYGRRLPGLWNFLTYAVKTGMASPGVPVKLVFTREQEMQHDYYRPNVTSRFRAVVGSDGSPSAWVNEYTTDDEANEEAHIFYRVPNQFYGTVKLPAPVPTGPWRSVESSWHGFFVESFIDELAQQANRDPLDYRLALLKDKPRHCETLQLAADKAGWGTALPSGHGRGVAIVECFGTIVAHVAEAQVANDGSVKVNRFTTAADCGMAVNPDGFKAQMEGAVIFGLSAALFGEITIDRGAVVQQNFPDYDMVRLGQCPEIHVYIHESDAPLGGAGEPGIPPVAPAVANAIFAASGIRVRKLPIKNHSLAATVRPG